MSDLRDILPRFPVAQYANLLAVLEKHDYTTADLLVLESAEIGKRTKLPLLDLQRLANSILAALHKDLGVSSPAASARDRVATAATAKTHHNVPTTGTGTGTRTRTTGPTPGPLNQLAPFHSISTLSPALDNALGGGIPAGYVTEIAGESGVGKTQLLLSLLLAVQLPPPHGLGRPAIYISTEAPLVTTRLEQILNNNPLLKDIRKAQWADGTTLADKEDEDEAEEGAMMGNPSSMPVRKGHNQHGHGPEIGRLRYPSLDGILSTITPDLESQEHILTFQVPVEIVRRNAGLLILDSVAANYRAEFEREGMAGGGVSMSASARNPSGLAKSKSRSMGARSNDLLKLGFMLRELARKHNMAVVVSNQVSDRIVDGPRPAGGTVSRPTGASNRFPVSALASSSRGIPSTPGVELISSMAETLIPKSSIDTSAPLQPPADWAEQLQLDHQQRWFSGWGDDPDAQFPSKTPSLGLVWSTQVSCRVALMKLPFYFSAVPMMDEGDWERDGDGLLVPKSGTTARKTWRRWMKVVFAPHVKASGQGLDGAVEYDITMGGLEGLEDAKAKDKAATG